VDGRGVLWGDLGVSVADMFQVGLGWESDIWVECISLLDNAVLGNTFIGITTNYLNLDTHTKLK
jgi:hypothetical protein